MTRRPIDWDTYLTDFHASFPGITEDVLALCNANGQTPFDWLTGGLTADLRMLDVGCGSGPAQPPDATRWVGLDRSAGELRRAVELGRATLLHGDITQLPIADRSVDVVTSSMAMMLVHPIETGLGEIRRVLRGGGELRLLLPTPSPLTNRDRVQYARLFWAARSTTKFPPTEMRSAAARTLRSQGFEVVSDESQRFDHPILGSADAERFIDSWYLPNTSEARRNAARQRAVSMAPFQIGIPLRRIIAQRS